MTRPARPADLRFYVDADVLGLAKILVQVRADVTYPGDPGGTLHRRTRPPCPIGSPAVKDDVWIPHVAALGLLIITRDAKITANRAEIAAVRESQARMIVLAGSETTGTWKQLEVFFCQWRAIEALIDQEAPFIYSATRTALRRIPLDEGVTPSTRKRDALKAARQRVALAHGSSLPTVGSSPTTTQPRWRPLDRGSRS